MFGGGECGWKREGDCLPVTFSLSRDQHQQHLPPPAVCHTPTCLHLSINNDNREAIGSKLTERRQLLTGLLERQKTRMNEMISEDKTICCNPTVFKATIMFLSGILVFLSILSYTVSWNISTWGWGGQCWMWALMGAYKIYMKKMGHWSPKSKLYLNSHTMGT